MLSIKKTFLFTFLCIITQINLVFASDYICNTVQALNKAITITSSTVNIQSGCHFKGIGTVVTLDVKAMIEDAGEQKEYVNVLIDGAVFDAATLKIDASGIVNNKNNIGKDNFTSSPFHLLMQNTVMKGSFTWAGDDSDTSSPIRIKGFIPPNSNLSIIKNSFNITSASSIISFEEGVTLKNMTNFAMENNDIVGTRVDSIIKVLNTQEAIERIGIIISSFSSFSLRNNMIASTGNDMNMYIWSCVSFEVGNDTTVSKEVFFTITEGSSYIWEDNSIEIHYLSNAVDQYEISVWSAQEEAGFILSGSSLFSWNNNKIKFDYVNVSGETTYIWGQKGNSPFRVTNGSKFTWSYNNITIQGKNTANNCVFSNIYGWWNDVLSSFTISYESKFSWDYNLIKLEGDSLYYNSLWHQEASFDVYSGSQFVVSFNMLYLSSNGANFLLFWHQSSLFSLSGNSKFFILENIISLLYTGVENSFPGFWYQKYSLLITNSSTFLVGANNINISRGISKGIIHFWRNYNNNDALETFEISNISGLSFMNNNITFSHPSANSANINVWEHFLISLISNKSVFSWTKNRFNFDVNAPIVVFNYKNAIGLNNKGNFFFTDNYLTNSYDVNTYFWSQDHSLLISDNSLFNTNANIFEISPTWAQNSDITITKNSKLSFSLNKITKTNKETPFTYLWHHYLTFVLNVRDKSSFSFNNNNISSNTVGKLNLLRFSNINLVDNSVIEFVNNYINCLIQDSVFSYIWYHPNINDGSIKIIILNNSTMMWKNNNIKAQIISSKQDFSLFHYETSIYGKDKGSILFNNNEILIDYNGAYNMYLWHLTLSSSLYLSNRSLFVWSNNNIITNYNGSGNHYLWHHSYGSPVILSEESLIKWSSNVISTNYGYSISSSKVNEVGLGIWRNFGNSSLILISSSKHEVSYNKIYIKCSNFNDDSNTLINLHINSIWSKDDSAKLELIDRSSSKWISNAFLTNVILAENDAFLKDAENELYIGQFLFKRIKISNGSSFSVSSNIIKHEGIGYYDAFLNSSSFILELDSMALFDKNKISINTSSLNFTMVKSVSKISPTTRTSPLLSSNSSADISIEMSSICLIQNSTFLFAHNDIMLDSMNFDTDETDISIHSLSKNTGIYENKGKKSFELIFLNTGVQPNETLTGSVDFIQNTINLKQFPLIKSNQLLWYNEFYPIKGSSIKKFSFSNDSSVIFTICTTKINDEFITHANIKRHVKPLSLFDIFTVISPYFPNGTKTLPPECYTLTMTNTKTLSNSLSLSTSKSISLTNYVNPKFHPKVITELPIKDFISTAFLLFALIAVTFITGIIRVDIASHLQILSAFHLIPCHHLTSLSKISLQRFYIRALSPLTFSFYNITKVSSNTNYHSIYYYNLNYNDSAVYGLFAFFGFFILLFFIAFLITKCQHRRIKKNSSTAGFFLRCPSIILNVAMFIICGLVVFGFRTSTLLLKIISLSVAGFITIIMPLISWLIVSRRLYRFDFNEEESDDQIKIKKKDLKSKPIPVAMKSTGMASLASMKTMIDEKNARLKKGPLDKEKKTKLEDSKKKNVGREKKKEENSGKAKSMDEKKDFSSSLNRSKKILPKTKPIAIIKTKTKNTTKTILHKVLIFLLSSSVYDDNLLITRQFESVVGHWRYLCHFTCLYNYAAVLIFIPCVFFNEDNIWGIYVQIITCSLLIILALSHFIIRPYRCMLQNILGGVSLLFICAYISIILFLFFTKTSKDTEINDDSGAIDFLKPKKTIEIDLLAIIAGVIAIAIIRMGLALIVDPIWINYMKSLSKNKPFREEREEELKSMKNESNSSKDIIMKKKKNVSFVLLWEYFPIFLKKFQSAGYSELSSA